MDSFQSILNATEGHKSLVLGNGFGISYDAAFGESNFAWKNLLDLCEIENDSPIQNLLIEENLDFELVHQKLKNALTIIERYSPGDPLLQTISNEIQLLKDQLVIAVSKSHPQSFNIDFTSEEGQEKRAKIRACRGYLNRFNRIFSLNYDLLLYWIRCFDNDCLGQDSFNNIDGYLKFEKNEDATYLFPHGALFLYRIRIGAQKLRSSMERPILARVEESIAQARFPMCISEGTGTQKLEAIKKNRYLYFSYLKLQECAGTVFTFGCSFMEDKDSHIIEVLLRSPASRIVVGEYNPTDGSYHRLMHEFEKAKERLGIIKEIIVADTAGATIWQP